MNYAIIVAGGKGSRFGSDLPKQFLNLGNKPILMHSIEAFHNYDNEMFLIVTLPQDQISYWTTLCDKHNFKIKHKVVAGGETRFHSVKNALDVINDEGLVGIHDGVRPLVDNKTIENCYAKAKEKGNAIPVVNLVDSIRKIEKSGTHIMVDRQKYKLIQTPQVFDIEQIKLAFTQEYKDKFTDDASVLEEYDNSFIELVAGNRQNIKITTSEDLLYAEAVLKSRHSL